MSVDAFLKLDGIKGESKDSAHKDEIDILSYSWGLSQSGAAHFGGGAGAGKVNVQDLNIVKRVDKSSPPLHLYCCNGKHIKSAMIVMRKAGEKPLDYIKITLEDVMVTSVQSAGHDGQEVPTESISFNFAKFKVGYQPQKADGSADGGEVVTGWSIIENKPL